MISVVILIELNYTNDITFHNVAKFKYSSKSNAEYEIPIYHIAGVWFFGHLSNHVQ